MGDRPGSSSDHFNASPGASTRSRARTSSRSTSKPDKFGVVSFENVAVPFKSFPGDDQSYKYHCRHGLFNHRNADYKFPPVISVCHHGMQLTGARKDKVCLCEIDKGWARHAQGGDKPVPVLVTGDGAGDRQLIPRTRGAIETGNDDNGAFMHDVLGAGENIPRGLNLQECGVDVEIDDINDDSILSAQ